MSQEIQIYPERCCGCMLCSLTCSAFHQQSFCPSKAHIIVKGTLQEAYFSVTIDQGCDTCLACVKICPTGTLQQEGGDD